MNDDEASLRAAAAEEEIADNAGEWGGGNYSNVVQCVRLNGHARQALALVEQAMTRAPLRTIAIDEILVFDGTAPMEVLVATETIMRWRATRRARSSTIGREPSADAVTAAQIEAAEREARERPQPLRESYYEKLWRDECEAGKAVRAERDALKRRT